MSNFRQIRPVVADLFHAHGRTDGQTDRHDEATSRFSLLHERAQKPIWQIQSRYFVL